MSEKTNERYIVRKPVPASELPHHEGLATFPVLMSSAQVPEADVWVTQLFVSNISESLAKGIRALGQANLHKHSAPEVYIIIGDEGAITAEVTLGDEKYEVSSPGCVYVPAGLPHGIRPLRAEPGKAAGFIPVVLSGSYTTEDV